MVFPTALISFLGKKHKTAFLLTLNPENYEVYIQKLDAELL